MREDNVVMLQDTLAIIDKGYYMVKGSKVNLKLSKKQREEARVFLPQSVEEISRSMDLPKYTAVEKCNYACVNMDSFSLARKRYKDFSSMLSEKDAKEILVLNLANPVHPGGGVRRGAKAQEEDLCRKSSLLLSLESDAAQDYYTFNKLLRTYMGSDAIILSPRVEIIKDDQGKLLEETVIVAVMTCAAPMVRNGLAGMSQQKYQDMVYHRIVGMLKCAAYWGYKNLVLGAFGCGAFGNDAHVVSDLFYKALKELEYSGMHEKDLFRSIDFAVLDNSADQYNFKEFSRNFTDFYGERD